MIFTLLAAHFGAAQEAFVVYEGAETNHFVDYHPGSNYIWGVYKNFNPDFEADPSEYYFVNPPDSNDVDIHWAKFGLFYLKVTETDATGCTNAKAQTVSVLPNNRLISFAQLAGNGCFSSTNNSFEIQIDILDNNGSALDSVYFPVQVEFTVNGSKHVQSVVYSNQTLQISDDWFNVDEGADSEVLIIMLSAEDRYKSNIPLDGNKYLHTIFAYPQLEFVTQTSEVYRDAPMGHIVELNTGESNSAKYTWQVVPENGTTTDLGIIDGDTATIIWDGPLGFYALKVSVLDGNGCLSDTIIQQIEIIEQGDVIVDAGRDTTIGVCNTYILKANVDEQAGMTYNYLWSPPDNLDDPTSAAPMFTPGGTTVFKVTVTNNFGVSGVDSVKITVPEIVAQAGDDILMYEGETAILDGTGSSGETIQYYWTTNSGTIDSGENTANPIVSGFGVYYLETTDEFGCVASDSVNVKRLAFAPITNDDYDTTAYKTEVKIAVLNNDVDPDSDIDSLSLTVKSPPFNGTAYVDFNDFTIHYIPNDGFSGNDQFEYQICDFADNCDGANVFVLVTGFKFLIPDAFSPNGDNINDYFEIIGIEAYEGNSIMIFNRWGNKVYQSINYGITSTPQFWDGKSNTGFILGDEELPTGTYYYVLNLGKGVDPIAGSVYLDR